MSAWIDKAQNEKGETEFVIHCSDEEFAVLSVLFQSVAGGILVEAKQEIVKLLRENLEAPTDFLKQRIENEREHTLLIESIYTLFKRTA